MSALVRVAPEYRHVAGRDCRLDRLTGWRLVPSPRPGYCSGYADDVGNMQQCQGCGRWWLCVQVGTEAWWRLISKRRARRLLRKARCQRVTPKVGG